MRAPELDIAADVVTSFVLGFALSALAGAYMRDADRRAHAAEKLAMLYQHRAQRGAEELRRVVRELEELREQTAQLPLPLEEQPECSASTGTPSE